MSVQREVLHVRRVWPIEYVPKVIAVEYVPDPVTITVQR